MDNQAVISNLITKTAFAAMISEEPGVASWDKSINSDFEQKEYQPGDTVEIRIEDQPSMPVQTQVYQNDPIVQQKVAVQVLPWTGGGFRLDQIQQELYYGGPEKVMSRIIKPRIQNMGVQANIVGYTELVTSPNFFGTAGADLTSFLAVGNGKAMLKNQLCSSNGVFLAISPDTMIGLADNVKNAFNPSKDASVAFLDGDVKDVASINLFETTNIPVQTTGTLYGDGTATLAVGTNPTTGATVIRMTGRTGTLKKNQIISFSGVYAVQPNTHKTLRTLRYFTVTADTNVSGSSVDVPVFPAIVGPENPKLQTCSALPTTASYIRVEGATVAGDAGATYEQAVIYHKKAIKFVSLKLEELIKCENSYTDSDEISVRYASSGDITNSQNINRLDMLIAAKLGRWQHSGRAFTRKLS